jgi:hypothetical protein
MSSAYYVYLYRPMAELKADTSEALRYLPIEYVATSC